MSEALTLAYQTIDDANADKPAATRRQLVAGAAAALGTMGVLGWAADDAEARHRVDPAELLAVAATAEVLATIVNTVGYEQVSGLDAITRKNIVAAAREELIHFQTLTSAAVGARSLTRRIWVPDAVFSSPTQFLTTLEVGDTLFVNAYLLATTVFGNRRNGRLARISAEFMGVEAVHRALARQSLGKLGNDRVYQKYSQGEEAPGIPTTGQGGYRTPAAHVAFLQGAGFGFGERGSGSPRVLRVRRGERAAPPRPSRSARWAAPRARSTRSRRVREEGAVRAAPGSRQLPEVAAPHPLVEARLGGHVQPGMEVDGEARAVALEDDADGRPFDVHPERALARRAREQEPADYAPRPLGPGQAQEDERADEQAQPRPHASPSPGGREGRRT